MSVKFRRSSKVISDWRVNLPLKGKSWKINKNAKEEHVLAVKKREDHERFLERVTDG